MTIRVAMKASVASGDLAIVHRLAFNVNEAYAMHRVLPIIIPSNVKMT